jgi:hypothetical protein
VRRVSRASPFRPRAVWLAAVALGASSSAALAQVDQHAEERFDEARANPTPIGGKGNWVIVPIPVANPTIGNGLQLAALYLHPKKPGDENAPGSTSGLVALGTDKDARVFGAFHDGSYDQDRYRLNVFAGSAKFSLKFYGTGENSPLADNPLPYVMDGGLTQVRGGIRIPGTEHAYAGLTYQFLQSTMTFKSSAISGDLPDVPASFHSAALGPQLTYDSRDSNYYPQRGQYTRLSWLNYAKRWGSDFEFDKVDAFYNHYLSLATTSVLALRVHYQAASEDTPFFFLPTLDMRGFSADRYRDTHTLSGSVEWRQKFSSRWGAVAYAEAGRFASSAHDLAEGRTIRTVGGGVRWRVTAERDMNIGIDYAVSSDDRAVFIQIAERF